MANGTQIVKYAELEKALSGLKENDLTLQIGLKAKIYRRHKTVPASAPSGKSTHIIQLCIANDDKSRKVALNRGDRLAYNSNTGEFWSIPGPGTFPDPVQNMLTYTPIGQSRLEKTDDPVLYGAEEFALTTGNATRSKPSTTQRKVEGGNLVVIFGPSGYKDTAPEHLHYLVKRIVVRTKADRSQAAKDLREFFVMLLTTKGQEQLLKPFIAGEEQLRAIEEAEERFIREARAAIAAEIQRERHAAAEALAAKRDEMEALWETLNMRLSDGTTLERRFMFEGVEYEFDPSPNGNSQFATIQVVGAAKFTAVPTMNAFNSGLLQAWVKATQVATTTTAVLTPNATKAA